MPSLMLQEASAELGVRLMVPATLVWAVKDSSVLASFVHTVASVEVRVKAGLTLTVMLASLSAVAVQAPADWVAVSLSVNCCVGQVVVALHLTLTAAPVVGPVHQAHATLLSHSPL